VIYGLRTLVTSQKNTTGKYYMVSKKIYSERVLVHLSVRLGSLEGSSIHIIIIIIGTGKAALFTHSLPSKILPDLSRIRPPDFHFFVYSNSNFSTE
jgi:hypothetical protein